MTRLAILCFILISVALEVVARCPNWCNQRGVCSAPHEGGNCICNMGFAGEDCSQRLCPAGYNPVGLEENTNRRAVRLDTGSISGILTGKFEFSFGGSSVYLQANANSFGSGECQAALSKLQSVKDITCVRETANGDTNAGSYLITINSYPDMPFMNNLVFHNGNPSRNMFHCNTSQIDEEDALGPYCRISDVEADGPLPVYSECSAHGACDRVYGKCACERGFKGDACNDMRDADDIVKHTHDGPFFTGSLMRLDMERDASEVFSLFSARLNGQNVTTITGDRRLVHDGDAQVKGGLTVGSSRSNHPANVYSGLSTTGNAVSTAEHHIRATLDEADVFTVDRVGNTLTAGSFSADNGTFTIAKGTAHGHDMKLSHNLEVSGSVNVEETLTIGSGFALTPGGMTVDVETHTGTLFELRSRQEGFNGSLLEIHTLGEQSSVIKAVSNGLTTFELASSGHVHMQGLRLTSGGVLVESGGIQVESGGVQVKGGLSVEGELSLSDADMKLRSISVSSSASNLKDSLVKGHISSKRYVGAAIDISAETQEGNGKFSFASFKSGDAAVFEIASDGSVDSAGGAVLQGNKGLTVHGPSRLLGNVQLHRSSVKPAKSEGGGQWTAHIAPEASYVVVEPVSAQDNFAVELVFDSKLEGTLPPEGRVVIVSNRGAKTTKGVAAIPSQSTVILVFNGQQWVDVEALKAPMHVLKEVTTFEAAADLNIGNYSLSAFSLSASALEKGRVIFSGSNGLLIDNDKFTYVKGLLTAPALRVERLQGNLDAKGYEVSNAVLVNAKIDSATIKATDITIAGESGVAYFNAKGTLVGSPSLTLDDQGHLKISELNSDVDVKGHTISNVVLENVKLERIRSAEVQQLTLSGPTHTKGGVLLLNDKREVVTTGDVLSTNDEGDVVIQTLKLGTLMAPLDANDQPLENVRITSGTSIAVEQISVNKLTVDELKVVNAAPGATRLVFADAKGKLQTHSDENSLVKIPNLAVDKLTFGKGNEVDLSGNTIKNVKFDADTVDFGLQNNFEVNSMKINELSKQDTTGKFLTASAEGKLEHLKNIQFKDGRTLELSEGAVQAAAIKTQSLSVTDVKSSLLGTNAEGRVVPLRSVEVDSAAVARELSVADGGFLSLHSLRSTLLAADASGRVISLNSAEGAATIPISVKSITSDMIVSAVVAKGVKAEYDSIYITNKDGAEGNILIRQEDGLIAPFGKGHLDAATGALHINQIQPVSAKDTLHLSHALIVDSNVSFSAIHASPSISTQTLSVSGVSDFNDDVAVDGTLTVHGNVIGSGPYVDSSDARFKKNIVPLNGSLEMVMKLNAVTYDFKTEDFPEREFPTSHQIGYVADEVLPVVPDLVMRDKDGYLGISYAKAAVIAAEAVKELKQRTDSEIGRLSSEVAELRKLVDDLLKRVVACEKS